MNEIILEVTRNIINRSKESREIYLNRVKEASSKEVNRSKVGCSNLAHTIAPMSSKEKELMADNITRCKVGGNRDVTCFTLISSVN